jgi:hypothetical protein
MGSTGKKDIDEQINATRSSCRPKRPPTTRNEDFLWVIGTSKTR